MKHIYKFYYLLDNKQKVQIYFLALLLLIGMLFEMLSLGAILPLMKIMIDPDKVFNLLWLESYLQKYTTLDKKGLILIVVFGLIVLFILKSIFLVYLSWKQASFSANLTAKIS